MTREEAIEVIKQDIPCEYDTDFIEALETAIQALSQEPCDDAISREAAINIASLHCLTIDETVKALERLPSVTPKPIECDDAVSRDAVLNTEYQVKIINDIEYVMLSEVQMKIRKMPSVTQKSGKWLELPKALNPNENPCKCSECGHVLSFMNCYPKSKYCPNCGCRMYEPQESEE